MMFDTPKLLGRSESQFRFVFYFMRLKCEVDSEQVQLYSLNWKNEMIF